MPSRKFIKRPVEIEAMQITAENIQEVGYWCQADSMSWGADGSPILWIDTLEGAMAARVGSWVIKGVEGEFYPCKDSIFQATYQPKEEAL